MKLILSICLFSIFANAYVPDPDMILDKTADKHGRGLYLIDQDVIFIDNNVSYTVHEQWIIDDGYDARMRAQGKKQLKDRLDITIIYKDKKKYYLDASGKLKADNNYTSWIEPFFHFRSKAGLKNHLLSANILSASDINQYEQLKSSAKENSYVKPGFINLARINGSISWAFGTPTPLSAEKPYPGLWIEQDTFEIDKFRLNDGTEVTASDYSRYSNGLYFPKIRRIKFKDSFVEIHTKEVRTMRSSKANKKLLRPNDIGKEDKERWLKMPSDSSLIVDFYSNAR